MAELLILTGRAFEKAETEDRRQESVARLEGNVHICRMGAGFCRLRGEIEPQGGSTAQSPRTQQRPRCLRKGGPIVIYSDTAGDLGGDPRREGARLEVGGLDT